MPENSAEFGRLLRTFIQSNGYDEAEVVYFLYGEPGTLPEMLKLECFLQQDRFFYEKLSSLPFMGISDFYQLVKVARPPEWLEIRALKPREGVDFTIGVDEAVKTISNQINFDEFKEPREHLEEEARDFLIGMHRDPYRRDLERNYVVDTTLPWRTYLAEN